MGKVVKLSLLGTEIVNSVRANKRAISGQAQAPWGVIWGVIGDPGSK